jgi:hypothetical protein
MKIRRIGLAVATAALAVSAFAGSVSAVTPAPATVVVAHGIPGAVVDVCVNGKEVKDSFRYGQQFKASLPAGSYTVRVWAHSSRGCHGTLLITKQITLTSGLNATAVARIVASKPALTVFVNDLTGTSATQATITVRHAASAGTVDVWLNGGAAPAVAGLARGASAGPVALDAGVYSWWVSAVGAYKPVIGPAVAKLGAGHAYQILAVGTNAHNFRFIVINQMGS